MLPIRLLAKHPASLLVPPKDRDACCTSFASNGDCSTLSTVRKWWTMSDLNRPPQACKASALPDELMAPIFSLLLQVDVQVDSFQLSTL